MHIGFTRFAVSCDLILLCVISFGINTSAHSNELRTRNCPQMTSCTFPKCLTPLPLFQIPLPPLKESANQSGPLLLIGLRPLLWTPTEYGNKQGRFLQVGNSVIPQFKFMQSNRFIVRHRYF